MMFSQRLAGHIFTPIAATNLFASEAYADEPAARNMLANPSAFVESLVDVLAFTEAAAGRRDKAVCISDLYFGTPAGKRNVVEKAWQYDMYLFRRKIKIFKR